MQTITDASLPVIPFTSPHVSVNRVRIVDLPGVPVDAEVRGQLAYDLLSTKALVAQAEAWAEPLHMPAALREDTTEARLQIGRFVDHALCSPDAAVAEIAHGIGIRLGRNLGHILATLHWGDAVNQAVRSDWTAADWTRWAAIRQVWLGGGLVSGSLGGLIAGAANDWLQAVGCGGQIGVAVTTSRRAAIEGGAAILPLLGAGRYLPAATSQALCLDFGHSSAKRACLHFAHGALQQIDRMAGRAVDVDFLRVPEHLLAFMVDTIVETVAESRRAGRAPGPDIMLSIAAYVRDGELVSNGLYQRVHTFGADARQVLSTAVSQRLGQPVRIRLIHDGTAAAAVHAGEPDTAVIMVGTALGVGFAPATDANLRPLAAVVR